MFANILPACNANAVKATVVIRIHVDVNTRGAYSARTGFRQSDTLEAPGTQNGSNFDNILTDVVLVGRGYCKIKLDDS